MNKKNTSFLVFLLMLTIALFFVNIFFAPDGYNTNGPSVRVASTGGPEVMVIPVEGMISASTSGSVLESLRSIANMNNIRGIILKINSPGGTTGTSQEIYNEIMSLRKKGIKVVSVIGDLGASGGYYIASASDLIVANGSSLTGSIGVIMSTMNFKGIADKFGVKSINFTSGKMKDMLSPFRDIRPDEEAYIKSMINTIYNQFVTDVLAGRNASQEKISKDKLLEIADGRVLTGIDAKKEGLIDVLGGFSVAKVQMQTLLKSPSITLRSFSRGYISQLVEAVSESTRNMTNINPISKVSAEAFLKSHLDTPLYYSYFGGGL